MTRYQSSYTRAARRRARRRRGAGEQARVLIKRTALALALAALLSVLSAGITAGKGEGRIVVRYADEHSEQYPEEETYAQTANAGGEALPAQSAAVNGVAAVYRIGSPTVGVSAGGRLARMELEDYVVGVVAAEMPASAEPEALKAQAVAARTFTALHMEGGAKCRNGCEGCDVCTDPACCQAYLSDAELRAFWGEAYETNINKVRSAVEATRGVVVIYEGRLISALYHASSGPATENSEAVFAVALPYLVSVESLEGEAEAVSVQEFSEAEFARRVNEAYPDARLRLPLKEGDIDVWGRTESGRVQLVQTGSTVLTGGQLRSLLSLKSTDFTVEITDGKVKITCVGYGHGVGMSQYGANEMAKDGYSYEEILLHYYTGTELAGLRFGE